LSETTEFLASGVLIGAGGSAFIDAWAVLLRRLFNVATLDYAMLGRWIGHFRQGRFFHDRIDTAEPIRGERPLGWVAHYSIGVVFAFLLLAIWGLDWARSPTIWPALLLGVGTVSVPWLIMQPGMGAGVAAARTANPRSARLRNLATHAVFGAGLYATALLLSIY